MYKPVLHLYRSRFYRLNILSHFAAFSRIYEIDTRCHPTMLEGVRARGCCSVVENKQEGKEIERREREKGTFLHRSKFEIEAKHSLQHFQYLLKYVCTFCVDLCLQKLLLLFIISMNFLSGFSSLVAENANIYLLVFRFPEIHEKRSHFASRAQQRNVLDSFYVARPVIAAPGG